MRQKGPVGNKIFVWNKRPYFILNNEKDRIKQKREFYLSRKIEKFENRMTFVDRIERDSNETQWDPMRPFNKETVGVIKYYRI